MELKTSIAIRVARTTPATTLTGFLTVCKAVPSLERVGSGHLKFVTTFHEGQLDLPADLNIQDPPGPLKQLSERLQELNTENIESIVASWSVNDANKRLELKLQRHENQTFDTIALDGAQHLAKAADALFACVETEFHLADFSYARFANLPAELREFHRSQEAVFAQREAALLAGHERLSRTIVEAEERAATRVEEVRREYAQHKTKLAAKHEESAAQLEKDRKAFDEAKKEFDDRERMHVRRDRENQLNTVLERSKDLELSQKTTQKRGPIHAACLVSLIASGALYGAVVSHGVTGVQLDTVHYSMLGTATLLFGSTLVFYLRWLADWAQKHAAGELQARAYGQDMLRAYWLVELLFEWRKENDGSEFPAEVLDALASGLFVNLNPGSDIRHPLASIIDSVSQLKKLSVSPKGTVEVERFESTK